MLKVFAAFKKGRPIPELEKQLDLTLNLPSYELSFRRYTDASRPPTSHVSKSEFRKMLVETFEKKEYSGTNPRLKEVQKLVLRTIEHLDTFERALSDIRKNSKMIRSNALALVSDWIPDEASLDGTIFVLVDPGMSFPWAYDGKFIGLDLMQFTKTDQYGFDIVGLTQTMAHEVHHLALQKINRSRGPMDADAKFASFFEGEGSAMKFCNNVETQLSDRANPRTKTAFLESSHPIYTKSFREVWKNYRGDLNAMIARAREDRNMLRLGKQQDLTYWLPDLSEGRMIGRQYYLGAEIMGVIYQAFGKAKVFEAYRKPEIIFPTYNDAVKKLKLPKEYLL